MHKKPLPRVIDGWTSILPKERFLFRLSRPAPECVHAGRRCRPFMFVRVFNILEMSLKSDDLPISNCFLQCLEAIFIDAMK